MEKVGVIFERKSTTKSTGERQNDNRKEKGMLKKMATKRNRTKRRNHEERTSK